MPLERSDQSPPPEEGDLGANPPQGWLFTASARQRVLAHYALALSAALGQTCIMAKAIGCAGGGNSREPNTAVTAETVTNITNITNITALQGCNVCNGVMV